MGNDSIVGGEFEVTPSLFESALNSDLSQPFNTYSSGRAALYHILNNARTCYNKNRILLPDYICESVIRVAESLDLTIQVYPITDSLIPCYSELSKLYGQDDIVLFVNYFGLLNPEEIAHGLYSIDEKMLVVQDNVQAPFSMIGEQCTDYSFTSFRKSFPSPDGAWAYCKSDKLVQPSEVSEFSQYKIAGNLLKGIGIHNNIFDRIYLELLEKGEELIDAGYLSDMSDLSKRIINQLDWARIKQIRQRNAKFIVDGLKKLELSPLVEISDNAVPLFVPIALSNRDKIRKSLFEHSIFCPIHWPVSDLKHEMKKGSELEKIELSIIIDQRYTTVDMHNILRIIERNI